MQPVQFSLNSFHSAQFYCYQRAQLECPRKVLVIKRIDMCELSPEILRVLQVEKELACRLDGVFHFQEAAVQKFKERQIETVEVYEDNCCVESLAAKDIQVETATSEELLQLIEACKAAAGRPLAKEEQQQTHSLREYIITPFHIQPKEDKHTFARQILQQFSAILHKILESFREERQELQKQQKEQEKKERLLAQVIRFFRLKKEIENEQIKKAVHSN